MRSARASTSIHNARRVQACALAIAVCAALAAPLMAAPPDAVIELWEQHWTLNAGGSSVYHSKQHVRLNNDRTYDEFADPRITYDADTDEIEIISARVQRADGTYCELPDYAQTKVSPGESEGWPAFASIRQHLIVMSGIETGCLVELEYKITSKPGAKPYLAADVRLDSIYPVRSHEITVETPDDVKWSFAFTGVTPKQLEAASKMSGHASAKINECEVAAFGLRGWVFNDLPGRLHESREPAWQTTCPRFAFTTAGDVGLWLDQTLQPIDTAVSLSDQIKKLATEWAEGCFEPAEKLRAIQKKLADTFNFVEFSQSWRPFKLRSAPEILRSNHGSPEEATALLLALARAADVPAQLGILTNDDVWTDAAPQRNFVAAYVVLLSGDGETEIWDAHDGRIVRNKHWAGYTLMSLPGGKLQRTALPAWTNADESRCVINGTVTVDGDGKLAGDLSLRVTGLFASAEGLRSTDAQKSRVNDLVHHVLPDANVENYTVKTLGANEFAVEAQIKSKALKKLSRCYCLQLAEDGPALADVHMPLEHSERTHPVRLAGAFDERIELKIEWPEGWGVDAHPLDVSANGNGWQVDQYVSLGDNHLMLERHTRIEKRELPATELLKVRDPLNFLRTDAARTLLLVP